ncbi:MFS transporter [Ruania alba]|uniref:MFS transporter n=1 Tax=Ruania alba TaxID=648782 RepID=UPI001FDFA02A|nr:MFS transporter [Ruania alba]
MAVLSENRHFRLLWWSNLFFFGGVWTQTLVLAWLAFELTGSEFLVALFTAVRLAPLLLGPFAGAFADRHDRVTILLVTSAWTWGAVVLTAVLASAGVLTYWWVVLAGLAIGLGQSPSQPARAALVLELVGRSRLSSANALNAMAMNMTQVVGPALGGVMIGLLGAPAALWIAACWFAAALLLVLPLRGVVPAPTREGAPVSAVRMVIGGLRIIARNRLAAAVLGVTLAANILVWPVYQAFLPVFAGDQLGLTATGLGFLLTCSGVGGLLGSLAIAGLGDFRRKGGLFVIGTGLWGVLWVAFAWSHLPALSYLLMIGVGLTSAAFAVLQTTLLLLTTEPGVHGRALGLQELAIGVMPLSSLVLGAVANQVGVGPTTMVSAGLLVAVMAVVALRTPALLRFDGKDPGGTEGPAGGGPLARRGRTELPPA